MMKFRNILAVLCLTLGGCASTGGIDTRVTHAAPSGISGSYQLEALGETPPMFQRVIENQLHSELATRRYRESETPAMVVRYYPVVSERLEIRETPTGPVYVGFRRGGIFVQGYTTELRNITEGSLYLAVVDAGNQELIWEGVASGTIMKGKPEKNSERIRHAITSLMADFPEAGRDVES